MKPSTLSLAALSIVLFSLSSCVCPRSGWKHVTTVPNAQPPRGEVVTSEDGTVHTLTLPNGDKYVSETKDAQTMLFFPNEQVFVAETAKGGFQPPYVSEVGLVGSVVVPSTQSGDLHLFIVNNQGMYREIPDVNDQITKALKKAGAPFEANVLRILDQKGRGFCLAALDYEASPVEANLFHVTVAPDGTISLGK